jgi:hypothetical protein
VGGRILVQRLLFNGRKVKKFRILKTIIKYGLILMIIFITLVLFYLAFQFINQKAWVKEQQITVKELTPQQKEDDFRYLTQILHEYYPFEEANKNIKGLQNLGEMNDRYINKAKETKNNREFLKLFNEYLQRIHQTGHAYILNSNEAKAMNTFNNRVLFGIKKDSFNKTNYWFNLWNSISDSIYADVDVLYEKGGYYVAKDFSAEDRYIPKGSKILRINGMSIEAYVKGLQNKHWLRYDDKNNKVFISDPFIVDSDVKKNFWNVEFELINGKISSEKITKRFTRKKDLRFYNNSYNDTFCYELNNEVGYIRIWQFLSDYSSDNEMLQIFMKNSKGKYKKLIIDIRGNNGGDPKYWMKVLIEPLVKRTTYYECYAAVRKEFLRKQGILFEIYRWAQGGLFNKENYNFYNAEKSDYNSADDKSLQAYKVIRKFEPTNSFPFKGEVYLLIDQDCFSAAEDFASAVKGMKLATLVGANTQGGAAALLPPYIFCLPESGVMFAMETEITYTSDGKIDEIYGTAPDIALEESTYPTTYPLSADKEEILKDTWIQQVLND